MSSAAPIPIVTNDRALAPGAQVQRIIETLCTDGSIPIVSVDHVVALAVQAGATTNQARAAIKNLENYNIVEVTDGVIHHTPEKSTRTKQVSYAAVGYKKPGRSRKTPPAETLQVGNVWTEEGPSTYRVQAYLDNEWQDVEGAFTSDAARGYAMLISIWRKGPKPVRLVLLETTHKATMLESLGCA